MISKQIPSRKDGRSSAKNLLKYGEGLNPDENGEYLDKSHRTRITNFDLVDDSILADADLAARLKTIELCAMEMQANCDLNTRSDAKNKIAHFMVSFGQEQPGEAVLNDVEDRMMAELGLQDNHRASFLHNDNGQWHMHIAVSRIEKGDLHRCNDLWQNRIKRDFVCREMELKHGLRRDNGYYYITPDGDIKKDPSRKRNAGTGDRAQSMEKHSGLLSFQGWGVESGLGAQLQAAATWADMHRIAGEHDCAIRQRGAGFVIVNRQNDKQVAKLSQLGVKAVEARLGVFQPASAETPARTTYRPEPIHREHGERLPAGRATHEQWREYQKAREDWRENKHDRLKSHGESVRERRAELRDHYRGLRQSISADRALTREDKEQRRSQLAMKQVQEEIALRERTKLERDALHDDMRSRDPGRTFRDYLVKRAEAGDELALESVRRYAAGEETDLIRKQEEERRRAAAAITMAEQENRIRMAHPVLNLTRTVHRNGSVDYDMGNGRVLTDTAEGKIKLSEQAVKDAASVEAGLMLAQKRFGSTLELNGPDEFKRFAVQTAVDRNIRVTFTDPKMEAYRVQLAEEKAREREQAKERSRRVDTVENTPARTEPTPIERQPSAPVTPAEPSKVQETPLQVEARADALAFIERRNELAVQGKEPPHRLATTDDLAKPMMFSELRTTDKDTGQQVAIFAVAGENGHTREKIVLPVDKEAADRLQRVRRGSEIHIEAQREPDGRTRLHVPEHGRSRGRRR